MGDAPETSEVLSDRLRLILLLDACEAADLAPIPVQRLHALAFLANVLAPVWSIESYDGKILKRKGGPFYPELQKQLDRLVGLGFVSVLDVKQIDEDGVWRLDATFALESIATKAIIERAKLFLSERAVIDFLRRLAFAASRLSRPLERLIAFDATWADERTGVGDVIDFSEWKAANYSAFAAKTFEKISPKGLTIGRGDQLPLYLRYLEMKANAKG